LLEDEFLPGVQLESGQPGEVDGLFTQTSYDRLAVLELP
jgi:hypothetical protein